MVYYKVVTRDLKSFIVNPDNPLSRRDAYEKFCIQYEIGKWIRPRVKGTKIMCFPDLNSAKTFLRFERTDGLIFECQAIKPRSFFRNPLIVDCWDLEYFYNVVTNNIKSRKSRTNIFKQIKTKESIPSNTILCDAIKLMKQVYSSW